MSFVLQNHVCSIDVEHLVWVNRHQDASNVSLGRKKYYLYITFFDKSSLINLIRIVFILEFTKFLALNILQYNSILIVFNQWFKNTNFFILKKHMNSTFTEKNDATFFKVNGCKQFLVATLNYKVFFKSFN